MTSAAMLRSTRWPLHPGVLAEVPVLRHQARETLINWWPDLPADVLDDVALLLTELASNALRHTGPSERDLRVELDLCHPLTPAPNAPYWVQVGVWDPAAPQAMGPLPTASAPEEGELAESGRGLLLACMLADEVVVEPCEDGKLVRARLLIAADAAPSCSEPTATTPAEQPASGAPVELGARIRAAAPLAGIAAVLAAGRAVATTLASAS
ncbi:ATP-binding protein [Streptacidiphilus sp. MAP5-52]|uniref:ATP-binding protein n=1 Tax=Streptacidiphilus sp. MAP5-52 TaxID=3156267 RepID=UPI003515DCB4